MKSILALLLVFTFHAESNAATCRMSEDAIEELIEADILEKATSAIKAISPRAAVSYEDYDVDIDEDFEIGDIEYGEIKVKKVRLKIVLPSGREQIVRLKTQIDKSRGQGDLELKDEDKFKMYLLEEYGDFGEVTSCLLSTHHAYFYLVNENTNQRVNIGPNQIIWYPDLSKYPNTAY